MRVLGLINLCHPPQKKQVILLQTIHSASNFFVPPPSTYKRLPFCTASQSSILFARWGTDWFRNSLISQYDLQNLRSWILFFHQIWWKHQNPKEISDSFRDEKHRHGNCNPFVSCVFLTILRTLCKFLLVLNSVLFVSSSQSNWLLGPEPSRSTSAGSLSHLKPKSLALDSVFRSPFVWNPPQI